MGGTKKFFKIHWAILHNDIDTSFSLIRSNIRPEINLEIKINIFPPHGFNFSILFLIVLNSFSLDYLWHCFEILSVIRVQFTRCNCKDLLFMFNWLRNDCLRCQWAITYTKFNSDSCNWVKVILSLDFMSTIWQFV